MRKTLRAKSDWLKLLWGKIKTSKNDSEINPRLHISPPQKTFDWKNLQIPAEGIQLMYDLLGEAPPSEILVLKPDLSIEKKTYAAS
jgi:hypothetical protein